MDLSVALQVFTLAAMLLTAYKVFFKQGAKSELADQKQKGAMDLLKSQLDAATKQNLELIQQATNHMHTQDESIKSNMQAINNLTVHIGKLETIIDERIPKKT